MSIANDKDFSFLNFELLEGNHVITQTQLFMTNFTANTLQDPKLQVSYGEANFHVYTLTLSGRKQLKIKELSAIK